jgi:hypothetical protein
MYKTSKRVDQHSKFRPKNLTLGMKKSSLEVFFYFKYLITI